MGYPLYVNIDSGSVANSLVRGSGSQASGTASPPEIVLGDKRELDFYFVDASGSYADFSGDNTYSLAIAISFPGGIKSRPSGGDFTLTFDGDTTSALPHDISAADLEDELNGLASVISAGLLDVTGPEGGPFIITFRTTGDKGAFSADASNLEPRSQVYATTTVEGDGSTQETVVIQLRRTVAAYQNSFAVITDDEMNPIGWSGELNASTEGLVALLADSEAVNAFFEVQVTDPNGNPRTYGQYKCTIRNQIIDPGTVSGPILEVLLTQSAADARYLQIANNLSDLDDVPASRANLGLGSAATQNSSAFATAAQGGKADTALQPGITFGSGVAHDGTIVAPNINQIPTIAGFGLVGASGKSFGAIDDIVKGRSADKVPLVSDAMLSSVSFTRRVFNIGSCSDEFTGDGSVGSTSDFTGAYSTGSTAGSTARIRNRQTNKGLAVSADRAVLPKTREHIIVWTQSIETSLGSNGIVYCTYGKPAGSAVGPVDDVEYVGFRISGASRDISIVYNTGSGSETVVPTGQSMGVSQTASLALRCDGGGSTSVYRAYLNGSFLGQFTFTTGTIQFGSTARVMTEISNVSDSADLSFVYFPTVILSKNPA